MSDLRTLATAVRAFVAWWGAELVGLLPRRFSAPSSGEALVIAPSEAGDVAALTVESGRRGRPLGHVSIAQGETGIALLRAAGILRAVRSGRMAVVLRLPARHVSRLEIELPIAAQADLEEAIGYDFDRHTPFSRDQAVFAARVLRLEPARKRLLAEVVVAPRRVLDDALAAPRALGFAPTRVEAADAVGGPASGNLLRNAAAGRPRQRRDWMGYGLGAAAACLFGALLWLPLADAHGRAAALAARFEEAKHSNATAVALQHEIEDLLQEERFLVDKKHALPSVLRLLLDSTRVVPDDAWLADWGVSSGEVRLSGSAASASALVDALERSQLFSGTVFLSPVTREPDGRERFSVSTRSVATAAPPQAPAARRRGGSE